MSNLKSILKSFRLQDELNPKIWYLPKEKHMGDPDGQEYKMRPKVRERLLEIASDFIDSLDVNVVFSDILMTGSLANYNWSEFSDVDLHIIVDYNQFPKNSLELYDELFRMKKAIYSINHDIRIFGYDVELYVEDENANQKAKNVGRFSILMDEWVVVPTKDDIEINYKLVEEKANQWMKILDGVFENIQDEDVETTKKIVKKYKNKLRKYRQCGLDRGGEYSDENLVFKILRRNGYLEKLKNIQNKIIDKRFSLNEATQTIGGQFKTDLANSPKHHKKRALGNWQSDNAWDVFAPPGTVVNSYTDGVVKKVKASNKTTGKIYGTQVTVQGFGDYPDIFYTHLKNVNLKAGDKVKVGDYIGEISEWDSGKGSEHVHIGLPEGRHLNELLVNSNQIFTGDRTQSPPTEFDTEELTNKISGELKRISGEDVEDTNTIADRLQKIQKGENRVLNDFLSVMESKKEYRNLKGEKRSIPFDKDVQLLQTGLQFLGFLLPKWGTDGRFGPETEQSVRDFQKKYGLTEDGVMKEKDILKMFSLLVNKDFNDSNMSQIKKEEDPSASSEPQMKGNIKISGNYTPAQMNIIMKVIEEMNNAGITNPYTQIGILSTIDKESNFKAFKEYGYCTTPDSRIIQVFGKRGRKCKSLKCSNPDFFDCVYGYQSGVKLGNDMPGDGWKYVGRGLNGLTGKSNYRKYGNLIGVDLVSNPEIVEDPSIAAKVAIAYFTKGKSASSIPNFTNEYDAVKYFADLNAGGRSSFSSDAALASSEKFEVGSLSA